MNLQGLGMFPIMFIIVPALMALVGLWRLVSAVWELLRSSSLSRTGVTVPGYVVSANVLTTHTGRDTGTRSRMVETIEFTTGSGQRVRGIPSSSDVGMLDRTGETVDVLHHRDRPDRFIAPRNGRSMSPAGPLMKIGSALVLLVFVGFFMVFAMNLFDRMSTLSGG